MPRADYSAKFVPECHVCREPSTVGYLTKMLDSDGIINRMVGHFLFCCNCDRDAHGGRSVATHSNAFPLRWQVIQKLAPGEYEARRMSDDEVDKSLK